MGNRRRGVIGSPTPQTPLEEPDMDLDERISRRLGRRDERSLIREYGAISPTDHLDEPVGREATLERLLDAIEPVFSGDLPPSVYVWGPKGSGKSALVEATFDRLASVAREQREGIHTATRTGVPGTPAFVYVDSRSAGSEFGLIRGILNGLIDEPVPDHGVSTDELRARLESRLSRRNGVVAAVDHVGEPQTLALDAVEDLLTKVDRPIAWVGVGRKDPDSLAISPESAVPVSAYRRHALVDLLTNRASIGLPRGALSHDQVRELARWADGDAHDALAALFGAAITAEKAQRTSILASDIEIGIEAVPRPCVSVGQVLSFSESRTTVLMSLLQLDDEDRRSVKAATAAIAARESVSLTDGTIRRLLYELAEDGVLERRTVSNSTARGRPPSRIEPRFPTLVFREFVE